MFGNARMQPLSNLKEKYCDIKYRKILFENDPVLMQGEEKWCTDQLTDMLQLAKEDYLLYLTNFKNEMNDY